MLEKNTSSVFNKNREERRKYLTKLLFVGFFLVIAIGIGGVAFLRKSSFQITTIHVTGIEALDKNLVQRAAQDFLKGHWLGVIPKSNTLLFSKRRMSDFLMNTFPGIRDVDVMFENKSTISVIVQEKKPRVVGCAGDTCFFLDDQGIAYKEAPTFSDGVFMIFSQNEPHEQRLGQLFLPLEIFEKFKIMTSNLQKLAVHPVEIKYGDQITIRIDRIIDYSTNPETKIILAQDTTSDDMVTALQLLFTDKGFLAQLQARPENLEYIDVRFPGKMYYKFHE